MNRRFFIGFIVGWCICLSAVAVNSPITMLRQTTDHLLSELKANHEKLDSNPTLIYQIVDRVLMPHVDISTMTRAVLGRKVWNESSSHLLDQFAVQFTSMLVRTYASALTSYTDERINFFDMREAWEGKKRVRVKSYIIRHNGPAIPMDYRLILNNDQWKVYDISVDGVSLLRSFRAQFSEELSQNSLESLIKRLAEHNKSEK